MSDATPYFPPDFVAAIADRFEEAWQHGRPDLTAFLPEPGHPLRREVLIELVHTDLERRLGAGEAAGASDYLERFPELADDSTAVADLTRTERRLRERRAPSIPGYEILGELGRGGMGVVYRARQVALNRPCALKMILGGPRADDDQRQRFLREAAAAARIQHPNVVQIFEIGHHDGDAYLALELIDGPTLARHCDHRPQPPRWAAEIVEVLAHAVHHVHARGVVHRDLKPGNILLASGAIPKITDFGLARQVDGGARLTESRQVMGTPSYMAPEQASGRSRDAGPPADVYALGAILYEMLTGRPPFLAETPFDTLMQVVSTEPAPVRQLQPGVPRDLETTCLKCLRKEPARRYHSAADLAEDLRRFRAGEPITARPVGPLEHAGRWCRRNPGVAALLLLLLLSLTSGAAVATVEWLAANEGWRQANVNAAAEQRQRNEAEATLYFTSIALAQREWLAGNLPRSADLLAGCPLERRGWEWHYLDQLHHAELASVALGDGEAAGRYAELAAISPDGKRVASAEGTVVAIRGLEPGMERVTLRRAGFVTDLAFSPDGQWLAVASGDLGEGRVRLYDAATGAEGASWDVNTKVTVVAFRADGQALAAVLTSGGRRDAVALLDANLRETRRFYSDLTLVTCLAFHPDGKTLAVGGGWRANVELWDVAGEKVIRTLSGHAGAIRGLAFRPDGKTLATAGEDAMVRLWDLSTGAAGGEWRGHQSIVTRVAFSPDGRQLASGGWDAVARVWDVATGHEARTLRGSRKMLLALGFAPPGQRLITAGAEGSAKTWDLTTDQEARTLHGHEAEVTGLCFSPDGKLLATASGKALTREARVVIWDADTGRETAGIPLPRRDVGGLCFSPDGRRLAGFCTDLIAPREFKVWDTATGREVATFQPADGAGLTTDTAFSPDGTLLAGAAFGSLRVWEMATSAMRFDLESSDYWTWVRFTPDGQSLLAANGQSTVKRIDWRTGQTEATPQGQAGGSKGLAFSSDGGWVAVIESLGDDRVSLRDTLSGKERFSLTGHTLPVRGLAFSPDGKRLASASLDRTVKIWDATTGREALTLRGHAQMPNRVAFSPDGRRLASAAVSFAPDVPCEIRVWTATPP